MVSRVTFQFEQDCCRILNSIVNSTTKMRSKGNMEMLKQNEKQRAKERLHYLKNLSPGSGDIVQKVNVDKNDPLVKRILYNMNNKWRSGLKENQKRQNKKTRFLLSQTTKL